MSGKPTNGIRRIGEFIQGFRSQYFMAMANHHDNLDLYDSKFQPDWNSTKIGPKKILLADGKKQPAKQACLLR